MRSYFALLMVGLMGCISATSPRNPGRPSRAKVEQRSGRIAYGLMAVHYDRDGDGIFEECRVGTTIYYDRNGDGICDLMLEDTPPFRLLKWDSNFDGILDKSLLSEEGGMPNGQAPVSISKPAPRMFPEDTLAELMDIPLGIPGHLFWSQVLSSLDPSMDRAVIAD